MSELSLGLSRRKYRIKLIAKTAYKFKIKCIIKIVPNFNSYQDIHLKMKKSYKKNQIYNFDISLTNK